MELMARQVQFQALEKSAADVLLCSRLGRAVVLALVVVFIDRLCHFLWKCAEDQIDPDLEIAMEPDSSAAVLHWPRLIGRGRAQPMKSWQVMAGTPRCT
ncbi:unnamed protein product [Durusdinium trenchii]|uniref:Uncharacterized protein n=1 Tax=Durusdinium trenchii TaxID=1381693 RepID=A0ABP0NQ98_9DINO